MNIIQDYSGDNIMNLKKGYFITFEGIDGCGKTTQMELLADYLRDVKDVAVIETREPGAKGLGEKIRGLLLDYDGDVSPQCEMFLFLADRAQNIDMIVNPAVEARKIVLCDRHTDSTIAYQGYGRGLDIEELNTLNSLATRHRKPDLTIVFDVDVQTSMHRMGKEQDRIEAEGAEFLNSVRNGYLTIAQMEPDRVKVVDASRSVNEIHKDVITLIDELLT